jgi:hypothetical protein
MFRYCRGQKGWDGLMIFGGLQKTASGEDKRQCVPDSSSDKW